MWDGSVNTGTGYRLLSPRFDSPQGQVPSIPSPSPEQFLDTPNMLWECAADFTAMRCRNAKLTSCFHLKLKLNSCDCTSTSTCFYILYISISLRRYVQIIRNNFTLNYLSSEVPIWRLRRLVIGNNYSATKRKAPTVLVICRLLCAVYMV